MSSPRRSRAATPDTAATTRGPAHAARLGRSTAARGVALGVTGVLAFGTIGGAAAIQQLTGNIATSDVAGLTGDLEKPEPADASAGEAQNILILGSDFRGAENTDFAVEGVEGMRSDTSIVAHISADRERVELVSIPRDSMIERPTCEMTDGSTVQGGRAMFNSAFATGADYGGDLDSAAACAVKTVQETTGVYIDDFVIVDFAGFENMVDAIDGVPMCIPQEVDDPKADLVLDAGFQTLDGHDALGYARARYTLGDGGDLDRIGRQQELIAATLNQVLSQNLLTDATGLYSFLDAATKSLTVSPGLSSVADLTGLAYSLRGINSGNITLMTIPTTPDPADPNRLVWTYESDEIWEKLATDEPLFEEVVPVSDVQDTGDDTTTTADGSDAAADGSDAAAYTEAATDATPDPEQTKEAGQEAFDLNDTTSTCE